MRQSTAWVVDLGHHRSVAVGERELLHLLPEPHLFDVPCTPAHCARVLSWQDLLLPVWDLRVWLGDTVGLTMPNLVAVVGYQLAAGQMPFFGALVLTEPPLRLQVTDEQACELPEGAPWQDIACSCFRHGEQTVPILDLRAMFAAPPHQSAVAGAYRSVR